MAALWILLGIVALVWLLLALPLRIFLRYDPGGGFSYRVKYLFFTLTDSAAEAPSEQAPEAAGSAKPAERKSDQRAIQRLLSFLGLEDISSAANAKRAVREKGVVETFRGVCAAVKALFSRTFALVRKGVFRRFELRVAVGDGDPSEAAFRYGQICAAVYPLITLLDSAMKFKRRTVDIRCDYASEQTLVAFDGQLNYRPWHFVCFLFHLIGNYLKKEKKKA